MTDTVKVELDVEYTRDCAVVSSQDSFRCFCNLIK